MRFLKNKLFLILILFIITSCRKEEVDGIKIGGTGLYNSSSFEENKKLCNLITGTIKKDNKSLSGLLNFNCGGASGCYDLGYIITQIIYKTGESDFLEIAKKLSQNDKNELNGFIQVGLEYYYEDKVYKTEFKDLYQFLNPKS